MSLVILLLLSSFFLVRFGHQNITQATISSQQLALVDTLEFYTDKDKRLNDLLATDNRSAWLHLAKLYAKEHRFLAYQIGDYYLSIKDSKSAVLWLQESVRHNDKRANFSLANYYYRNRQYQKVSALLLPIIEDERALVLLSKLALRDGDINFINEFEVVLSAIKNQHFYDELKSYSVFDTNEKKITRQCDIDVQLFATNLSTLRHAKLLVDQFKEKALARYICLYSPKYMPKQQLNCQHSPNEKISCKANAWSSRDDISSRYIGVIVEQGGANVDNGIMYLDKQDDINVLTHELTHFLGFIDEYSLPVNHSKCQSAQKDTFSHNVVVLTENYHGKRAEIRARIIAQLPWAHLIKSSTPILTRVNNSWKLTTPKLFADEVGVFPAKTCDNKANKQAFKPIVSRTKLEYFELALPNSYIDILKLAPKKYLMPSYHFNVSRDLAEQGEYKKAREILQTTLFD